MKQMVESYFPLHPLHYVSTLLDPMLKSSSIIWTAEKKAEAIDNLRKLVKNFEMSNDTSLTASTSTNNTVTEMYNRSANENELLTKRVKMDFYSELYADAALPISNEVDVYIGNTDKSTDILGYWKAKASVLPKLAKVAQYVLCIPATSTSSERSFSIAGRTLDDRRSQLAPEAVDDLLFLHGLHNKSRH